MALSTTAFGVYFYLISKLDRPSTLTLVADDDLTWLALASMAVFITGGSQRHTAGNPI